MNKRKWLALWGGGMAVVGLAWWWGARTTLAPPVSSPPAALPRASARSPVSSALTSRAPATTRLDPVFGWATEPGGSKGPAGAIATAEAFAWALLSVPPGAPASVVAAHCAGLVTPAFLAQLATSPGAPVLAEVAEPVMVTAVAATVDDWAGAAAGVDLGISLRAGRDGPPSFLAFGVHVEALEGAWRVDGMEQ